MSDQQSLNQGNPANIQSPTRPVERPRSIKLAVIGMWIGAALAALNVVVAYFETLAINKELYAEYDEVPEIMDRLVHTGIWLAVGIAAVIAAVEIAMWTAMALTNRAGFGWARIVATVLAVLNIALTIATITMSIINDHVVGISVAHGTANLAIAITITVLVWLPTSTSFYRARKIERAQRVVRAVTVASTSTIQPHDRSRG